MYKRSALVPTRNSHFGRLRFPSSSVYPLVITVQGLKNLILWWGMLYKRCTSEWHRFDMPNKISGTTFTQPPLAIPLAITVGEVLVQRTEYAVHTCTKAMYKRISLDWGQNCYLEALVSPAAGLTLSCKRAEVGVQTRGFPVQNCTNKMQTTEACLKVKFKIPGDGEMYIITLSRIRAANRFHAFVRFSVIRNVRSSTSLLFTLNSIETIT